MCCKGPTSYITTGAGRTLQRLAFVAAALLLGLAQTQADPVDPTHALVQQMRQGGLILVFRNSNEGVKQAAAVGRMLRELQVPTGDTYTSMRKTAVETARLARFRNAMALSALTDRSAPGSASDDEDLAEAFRELLRERTHRGDNVVMVADAGRIAKAIGTELAGMKAGELVVVRPDVRIGRGFAVAGRLTLQDLTVYRNSAREF